MSTELAELREYIRKPLEQIVACLDGLSEAQLNHVPDVEGGNSPYVLASHVLGNARAWVLGIACGRDIGRDRPAEFRATGADAASLRTLLGAFLEDMEAAFGTMTPADLDRRLTPSQELWGEHTPHEISVREALMQVIYHASLHLGHLEMTRALALEGH
jgi:hypothetical protein